MSQSTTRTLVRSGVIGAGVGLFLGAAVSLFAAPMLDINQFADWNAPWGISAETQLAEGGTVHVRVVANESYDLGTPLQASVQ